MKYCTVPITLHNLNTVHMHSSTCCRIEIRCAGDILKRNEVVGRIEKTNAEKGSKRLQKAATSGKYKKMGRP